MYPLFGCRRDALFEALDAVLSAPTLETPAHLSLAPRCQRGWGSLYEALNAGTMDLARLERLVSFAPLEPQTTWFAVDASVWPRCDAETSPERGLPSPLPPFARAAHCRGMELLLAGAGPAALLELDGASARPAHYPRGEPHLVAAEQIRSWLEQSQIACQRFQCTHLHLRRRL